MTSPCHFLHKTEVSRDFKPLQHLYWHFAGYGAQARTPCFQRFSPLTRQTPSVCRQGGQVAAGSFQRPQKSQFIKNPQWTIPWGSANCEFGLFLLQSSVEMASFSEFPSSEKIIRPAFHTDQSNSTVNSSSRGPSVSLHDSKIMACSLSQYHQLETSSRGSASPEPAGISCTCLSEIRRR